MKLIVKWEKRVEIIEKAYSQPNNIKATARFYDVEPVQIRRWKKRYETLRGEMANDPKKM
jgi:transposase-like protein